MSIIGLEVAVPNGVLLLLDVDFGVLPELEKDEVVAATSSCVVVGTVHAAEGNCTVTLSSKGSTSVDPPHGLGLLWEGQIQVPSGKLSLATVLWDELGNVAVPPLATVRIYADDPQEPSVVTVLCD